MDGWLSLKEWLNKRSWLGKGAISITCLIGPILLSKYVFYISICSLSCNTASIPKGIVLFFLKKKLLKPLQFENKSRIRARDKMRRGGVKKEQIGIVLQNDRFSPLFTLFIFFRWYDKKLASASIYTKANRKYNLCGFVRVPMMLCLRCIILSF